MLFLVIILPAAFCVQLDVLGMSESGCPAKKTKIRTKTGTYMERFLLGTYPVGFVSGSGHTVLFTHKRKL